MEEVLQWVTVVVILIIVVVYIIRKLTCKNKGCGCGCDGCDLKNRCSGNDPKSDLKTKSDK